MWEPEPGWHPLPSGSAPAVVGVWRTADEGQPLAVKRLSRPATAARPGHSSVDDPAHLAYWRREADLHISGLLERTPGLRSVPAHVEEDSEGVTITSEWVEDAALTGLFVAAGLARFAGADLPRPKWLARSGLRDRMAAVEQRGGWSTIARTTVADIADHLWRMRERLLDELDALPQVPCHGDATLGNLIGRTGDDVIGIDWSTMGLGPVGADLGYLAISSRESFEPLMEVYLAHLPSHLGDPEQALVGARTTAVLTAMNRADAALASVAGGEGPLASKFRHPAVATHLRVLQQQSDHIKAIIGW